MIRHPSSPACPPVAPARPIIRRSANSVSWGLGFLVSAIPIATWIVTPPSADISWLLYATRLLLRGARLGPDILEVSPPMIFALNAPVVAIAAWIGFDPARLWFMAVGLVGWLMVFLSLANMRQLPWVPRGASGPATLVLAWLLFVLPGGDFGQRDHVAILLILPSVGLAVARVSGNEVGRWSALLTGMAAALGVGLKPHFGLVALAMIVCERATLRPRRIVQLPEHVVAGFLLGSYVLATVLLAPGYLGFVTAYGTLYQQYLPAWLFANLGVTAIPALAVVTAYAISRSAMPPLFRRGCDVLAATTFSFHLAALLQAKGWSYHFVPANILAGLLLAAMMLRAGYSRVQSRRLPLALGIAAYGLVFVPSLGGFWSGLTTVWATTRETETQEAANQWSALIAPGEQVAVLSTAIESSFPMVTAAGAEWAFRFPHMWPLVVFNQDRIGGRQPIDRPAQVPVGAREAEFLQIVCEDLVRTSPQNILVVRQRDWPGTISVAERFDYRSYLSFFPPLAAVLRQYGSKGRLGDLDVLVLLGPRVRGVDCEAR